VHGTGHEGDLEPCAHLKNQFFDAVILMLGGSHLLLLESKQYQNVAHDQQKLRAARAVART